MLLVLDSSRTLLPIELGEGGREGRDAYTPCPESGIQSLHLQEAESPWWTSAGNGQQETPFCFVLFCCLSGNVGEGP